VTHYGNIPRGGGLGLADAIRFGDGGHSPGRYAQFPLIILWGWDPAG